MTAGTSYAILVNNFSTSGGFTLSFGTGAGTGTFLGPNPIITANPTTICAGEAVTFDALNSTNIAASGYNWNFNNGGSPTAASGVDALQTLKRHKKALICEKRLTLT